MGAHPQITNRGHKNTAIIVVSMVENSIQLLSPISNKP